MNHYERWLANNFGQPLIHQVEAIRGEKKLKNYDALKENIANRAGNVSKMKMLPSDGNNALTGLVQKDMATTAKHPTGFKRAALAGKLGAIGDIASASSLLENVQNIQDPVASYRNWLGLQPTYE